MRLRLILIILGALLILAGVLLPYLSKIPFGKLPGDIIIDKPNVKIFIPITSMLIISILLSLIMLIIQYIRK